jgi:hypothetical protein
VKRTIILVDHERRSRALEAVSQAPLGYAVTIAEPSRTLSQNAAQFPILEAFAAQLKWPVNGHMVSMDKDEWKQVLSAAFRQETVRVAMGLTGGVVMLGARTSKFSKREFSEWLEYLHATAVERGVQLEKP